MRIIRHKSKNTFLFQGDEQIDSTHIVLNLLKQFGDEVPIKRIAQYAEDEYMIPYKEAVNIILDDADRDSE